MNQANNQKFRKIRFWRAALALAGEKELDVCKKIGWSRAMVYLVLRGKAKSRRLSKKIDLYINKHLQVIGKTSE